MWVKSGRGARSKLDVVTLDKIVPPLGIGYVIKRLCLFVVWWRVLLMTMIQGNEYFYLTEMGWARMTAENGGFF